MVINSSPRVNGQGPQWVQQSSSNLLLNKGSLVFKYLRGHSVISDFPKLRKTTCAYMQSRLLFFGHRSWGRDVQRNFFYKAVLENQEWEKMQFLWVCSMDTTCTTWSKHFKHVFHKGCCDYVKQCNSLRKRLVLLHCIDLCLSNQRRCC